MPDKPVAAVLGVGPGLGSALARKFAKEGYALALMARGLEKLTPVKDEIEFEGGQAICVPTDATDPASVAKAFALIREQIGDPEVLVYNAGAFQRGGILELDVEAFERCWKANCMGGFLAAKEVLPGMQEAKKGTILFTGATAALRGSANYSALAVGKFGLRALAQSMAREFGPQGIHVAHIIVDGMIDLQRTREMMPDRPTEDFLNPDAIAETYWHLTQQDPTVWTLELDVRPANERF